MGEMPTELPPADDVTEPVSQAGPDHPIRVITRQIAFEDGWSPGRAAKISDLFDGMAAEWHSSHSDPVRLAPIADAIKRGGLNTSGRWLELGAGTGAGTLVMKPHVDQLFAMDLSAGVLANGADGAMAEVQADSSALPLEDASVDVVVCVNMFLFPTEVNRVLKPGGQLLWVNTLGDQTPIHLPASDVQLALPGEWAGKTANSGMGFWAVLSRT